MVASFRVKKFSFEIIMPTSVHFARIKPYANGSEGSDGNGCAFFSHTSCNMQHILNLTLCPFNEKELFVFHFIRHFLKRGGPALFCQALMCVDCNERKPSSQNVLRSDPSKEISVLRNGHQKATKVLFFFCCCFMYYCAACESE